MNFFTALGLTFVVLKLVGVIHWSWWLVLLPFYGGLAVFLFLAFLVVLVQEINR